MFQDSSSYCPPEDRYSGIRALWLKVIIRAIFDWVAYRDCLKLEKKKVAEQAYIWLFHANKTFNSFENLCAILDVSPYKVRKKAMSMTREQVAKIEHLERDASTPDEYTDFVKMILP
jgi:hypothetical protein